MISRYESFTACISSLYHAIQKIERAEMEAFGLKGPHAHCLLVISRHPEGLTAARLCELCEKDKAAVSRILSELVREGMVSRECRNGTHYRALLKLTEKGQHAAGAVYEKARLAVERASGKMDDVQREFFYRMLSSISENLTALCKDGLSKSIP
ncbi:MAG: MarR family transcriptional regulator [Oscillospiraceae bacterium]|nr:MarR family transcriptional regulator [Oscillospiraceae bacterium]